MVVAQNAKAHLGERDRGASKVCTGISRKIQKKSPPVPENQRALYATLPRKALGARPRLVEMTPPAVNICSTTRQRERSQFLEFCNRPETNPRSDHERRVV